MCVWAKEQAKSFHKIPPPSDSVSQQGGWEGVTCVSTTSESSFVFGFGRKWAKITPPAAQFFSLEVTDTFSLTPCARTVHSAPQCWFFFFAQNFLKIRFVLHRNRIFLGRKSSRPISQILSFWSGGRCLYGGERLTGSLGFPRWPEEASTRTQDPTSRGRTLPTMRGLWSSNHIGIWKPQTEYCKKFNWSQNFYIFTSFKTRKGRLETFKGWLMSQCMTAHIKRNKLFLLPMLIYG